MQHSRFAPDKSSEVVLTENWTESCTSESQPRNLDTVMIRKWRIVGDNDLGDIIARKLCVKGNVIMFEFYLAFRLIVEQEKRGKKGCFVRLTFTLVCIQRQVQETCYSRVINIHRWKGRKNTRKTGIFESDKHEEYFILDLRENLTNKWTERFFSSFRIRRSNPRKFEISLTSTSNGSL